MRAARLHHPLSWWALAALPLAFLGLFFLWPLGTVLARGLTDAGVDLAGMIEILTSPRTADAVVTTLLLATAGTVGSVVIGVPAAYALYRLRWRGQATVRALAVVPFVLPTIVVASAFTALFGRSGGLGFLGLDQSMVGIVLALVFYNVAVVLRVVGGAWAALDPAPTEAARTLGADPRRAFLHVTLPALAPAIGSAAAVVFLFCATSFGVVLVLGGTRINTIETEIYLQVAQFLDLRAAAVLSILQLLFVGIALAVAAWARRRRDRSSTMRRVDGTRLATRGDAGAIAVILVVLALLVSAPLVALVERSLRTTDGHGVDHYVALFGQPGRAVLPVPVWAAAVNSLAAATVAAAVATGLGLIVASLLMRRTGRSAILDSVVMLPLGVSAVIVGLGMLLTLNRSVLGVDLRGSWWLVPMAQAVIALPLVVRTLVPSARAIPAPMRDAASTLGASPWQVWRLVDWPLLRRPFGLALGFAFAISLGEFGATTFVARPDQPTLPTAIYRLLGRPGIENVGMAFAAAVVLALMTASVMMVSERMRTTVGSDL
ncbi:ABC transporter permease [Demequina activiva]|uniref:Iron ABC transporter permease n=1 Tax=Demequina activiva TaxID=1582364 RepID=A0A919UK47_9MICO|nr:iron ABC transporter permease [Demequina activiva]GIG54941.1 iron ABC transporter permease [Demequina activiva]